MARQTLYTHTKFRKLIKKLGVPKAYALGCLQFLWEVAYASCEPIIGDMEAVELAAEWEGEPGKFVEAALTCGAPDQAGFIEPTPGRDGIFQIHDLFENAPDNVLDRAEREAKRKSRGETISSIRSKAGKAGAASRWNGKNIANADNLPSKNSQTDNKPMANDSNLPSENGNRMANCHRSPAPPRLNNNPSDYCSEPVNPASEPAIFLEFPVVGKQTKKTWYLTTAKLAEYRECFPGVDVATACRNALQWTRDNPVKRKTPKGMPAFLTRWLAKEQNRGIQTRESNVTDGSVDTAAIAAQLEADRATRAREDEELRKQGPIRIFSEAKSRA